MLLQGMTGTSLVFMRLNERAADRNYYVIHNFSYAVQGQENTTMSPNIRCIYIVVYDDLTH